MVSLYIGIAATGMAYLFFNYGLSRLPASTTVTLTLAEPLAAAVLGVLAVGERISGTGFMGILLMLGAILLLTLPTITSRSKRQ
ncbi:EamA-like transporter family protein [compost metagenome]